MRLEFNFTYAVQILSGSVNKYVTSRVLYVIECQGCRKMYIGETGNLRFRTNLHRDHATKNIGLGVSRHLHASYELLGLLYYFILSFFVSLVRTPLPLSIQSLRSSQWDRSFGTLLLRLKSVI